MLLCHHQQKSLQVEPKACSGEKPTPRSLCGRGNVDILVVTIVLSIHLLLFSSSNQDCYHIISDFISNSRVLHRPEARAAVLTVYYCYLAKQGTRCSGSSARELHAASRRLHKKPDSRMRLQSRKTATFCDGTTSSPQPSRVELMTYDIFISIVRGHLQFEGIIAPTTSGLNDVICDRSAYEKRTVDVACMRDSVMA